MKCYPITGGITLLIRDFSTWRLVLLASLVGLLLAGLVPHPWLVCGHCCQGERGVCSVGRQVWKTEQVKEG